MRIMVQFSGASRLLTPVYRLGIGIPLFLFYVDPWLAVIKSPLLATVDSTAPTSSRLQESGHSNPFSFLAVSRLDQSPYFGISRHMGKTRRGRHTGSS